MEDEAMETTCSFCHFQFELSDEDEPSGVEGDLCPDCKENTFICCDCHSRVKGQSSVDICDDCAYERQQNEEDERDPSYDPEAEGYYGDQDVDE